MTSNKKRKTNSQKTIGKRIKELREKKGETQADLAKELYVKRETVNQWENETRDLKTAYTIKLADYYNTTCDYILRGVQSENVDINRITGLSDEAIEFLNYLKENNKQNLDVINNLFRFRLIKGLDFYDCFILKIAEYFNLDVDPLKIGYIFNQSTKNITRISDEDLRPDEEIGDIINEGEFHISIAFFEELLLKEINDLLKKERNKYKRNVRDYN